MIRIARGHEPAALASVRATRLPAAVAATRAGHEVNFDGYRVAHATLYQRQHGKCAYCERQTGDDGEPVEHFRPKAETWRGDPWAGDRQASPGYWWLAWSWENFAVRVRELQLREPKGQLVPAGAGDARARAAQAQAGAARRLLSRRSRGLAVARPSGRRSPRSPRVAAPRS